ncbi:hypothetical protein C7455_101961 [Roseicyclus mahoneyensis]|uniref:Uncharacterized protein n=2 Tax=Roseicyclus mahoneyensis TaxID=164332 RepID=A0A316GR92_9RHOB|nr:hypothetical protein C7455_101961 [Roseicyclus mahoneyensis]
MLGNAEILQCAGETIMARFLMAMVGRTFATAIGRRQFAAPIQGALDLTKHLMALVVFRDLPQLGGRI